MHKDQRKAFSLPLSRLIYYFQTRQTSAALILECPFKRVIPDMDAMLCIYATLKLVQDF